MGNRGINEVKRKLRHYEGRYYGSKFHLRPYSPAKKILKDIINQLKGELKILKWKKDNLC